jgi:hypothetical protein
MSLALRRAAAILAAGLVALLGLALPAAAVGGTSSFDWNGLFSHRLDSRSYYATRSGTHTVTKTDADCPGPGSNMQVRLVREIPWVGDAEFPWKAWDCTDDDQSRSWITDWSNTNFHFSVEKSDTTDTSSFWYVKGNTVYPTS